MLKKLVLICAAIFIFQSGAFKKDDKERRTPFFYDAQGVYTVYIGEGGSLSQINSFSTDEMEKFYSFDGVFGESVRVESKVYLDTVIKRFSFEKVLEERIEGISVCYYYSKKIPAYKSINGKKVNLQTAVNGNIYTIGTPMIYGSF